MSVAGGIVCVMNQPLQFLENDLESLRQVWLGALPKFGGTNSATDAAGDVASMSDAGLVAVTSAVAHLVRASEAVLARVAGEVAKRSPSELGRDGLAKKQGFLNSVTLVAAATGGSVASAARMVQVGKATAPRQSLTGEVLPPAHPHVAEAVNAGRISSDAAAAITSMLDRVAPRAHPEQADEYERVLAEHAADLPHSLVMRMVREAEARLDQDGLAPREEDMRASRFLGIREDEHGMLRLTAALDPATGAPIKVAIEALVTKMIRARRTDADGTDNSLTSPEEEGGDVGSVVADDRSVPQMQADALAMIAGHVLGCARMPSGPAVTMVVRTELATLTDGIGHGHIDGLSQPVSAGTIRKMAATAGLIPAVFDGDSLPLDLGRDARLFSWPQRLALAERDGGCASCGLDVAYTEAHHIDWWKRDDGPTDLDNGVLLCPPCHGRIHDDGWIIKVHDGQVWFIPPPHVDINQTPRLGGKARYALPQADVA